MLLRIAIVGLLALQATAVCCQEPEAVEPAAASQPLGLLPNITAPTLGGSQFWTDEMIDSGWRIQRNVYTEHCRLLDEHNYRRAWGGFDACLAKYHELRARDDRPPVTGKAVILLHGLGGTRWVMNDMAEHLAEHGDYTPINIGYASTRRTLDQHAGSLEKIIGQLDQASRIDIVSYSMGNIVVRRYLALCRERNAPIDPRIGRMVMIGPPNQAASLARVFRDVSLFSDLLGPSAVSLAEDNPSLQQQLATPPFEFGIVAGTAGVNPLLEGVNDFLVTVEETKLSGARDFTMLPLIHPQLTHDEECQRRVLCFLERGWFVAEGERRRIE